MTGRAGIDIVPVARIDKLIRERGDGFLRRWFSAGEIAYCSRKAVPSRHFAARFAAKEAVVKVLPGRWDGPLPWASIEVVNNDAGAPAIRLSGTVLDLATRSEIGDIAISMSHCEDYATAVALTDSPMAGRGSREQ